MLSSHKLFVTGVLLTASVAIQAQGTSYGVGRAATQEEIQAWDIAIHPEGKELPAGSGTAKVGAQIFAMKCAGCHGPNAIEGEATKLVGKNTVSTKWPFATNIWDYINRGMPLFQEGSLKPDEVYALTAFLLFKNGIIKDTDVMNRDSLPKVPMPNRDGYRPPPEWKPGIPDWFFSEP